MLRLERNAVLALAALHQLTADGPAAFLGWPDDGDSPLRHHVREQQAYYEWVAADGVRSPLIERGFTGSDASRILESMNCGDLKSKTLPATGRSSPVGISRVSTGV